jgi:hypothetical protein
MTAKRVSSQSIFDPDMTSPTKKAKQIIDVDTPVEWTPQQIKLLSYLRDQGKTWKYVSPEIKRLISRELMGQFPGRKEEEIQKAYKMRAKLGQVFTEEDV